MAFSRTCKKSVWYTDNTDGTDLFRQFTEDSVLSVRSVYK